MTHAQMRALALFLTLPAISLFCVRTGALCAFDLCDGRTQRDAFARVRL